MPVPRIFTDQDLEPGTTVTVTGSPANHVRRVLRLSPGDEVVLFDGSGGEFGSRISAVTHRRVELSVGAAHFPSRESAAEISLWQGICRGARMDIVIQKATELGVTSIQPVHADRSVVRLDEKSTESRLRRWRKIAISACEQSGRVRLPDIRSPATLAELKDRAMPDRVRLILLDPAGDGRLGPVNGSDAVTLLAGPEGGLSAAERDAAIAAGFRPTRLGPRTLRTETAPLAAISIIQYLCGDLGDEA